MHLAVYDRLLGPTEFTANIIDGQLPEIHAGYPSDADIDAVARALRDAKRPLMYVGDGVWKSGAIAEVTALAERFGVPVVGDPRAVSIKHPLHAGGRRLEQAPDIDPDLILCIGVTHNGAGNASDYTAFFNAERTIAIGADAENLENIPGLDLAVLADEKRAAQGLLDATDGSSDDLSDRRSRAREEVARAAGAASGRCLACPRRRWQGARGGRWRRPGPGVGKSRRRSGYHRAVRGGAGHPGQQ